MYPLIRSLLFLLDAEKAHHFTLNSLALLHGLGLTSRDACRRLPQSPRTFWGLNFPNPLGLAAGLDKNGEYVDALSTLGFGFIEVGTVTPKSQEGNPRPRLFRIPEARAIINRMGFNNKGVDYLLEQVYLRRSKTILGINIGKNASTPIEHAVDDYLIGLEKVYVQADYITVNISSPNTKNLRQLQQADELGALLKALKHKQSELAERHAFYKPLLVKIAPDLDETQIGVMADILQTLQLDGVIATNTTLDRTAVSQSRFADEAGGLSGAPLMEKSTWVVQQLRRHLPRQFPIIAAGGIDSVADARTKIQAGADLLQIYSGLIYQGPGLIKDIVRDMAAGDGVHG